MEKIRFYSTLLNLQRFADPEPTPASKPTPNSEPNPEPEDKPFKAFKNEN